MSARLLAVSMAIALALAPGLTRACPQAAVTGTQPCDDVLRPAMISAGSGTLGASGWPIQQAYAGIPAALGPGWVPCVILSAVGETESSWHQFGYVTCGQSAPTLVSSDCGYGIGQITSGMDGTGGFDPTRVAGEPLYNLSVSANILIEKWNYAAGVTPNSPKIAEDWYFALWAYNGLAASNNPNTHSDTLGTYYDPNGSAYPRSHYAYEEIVYGYALYPTTGTDGNPRWPSTKITHIDFTQICASCGNPGSSLMVSEPSPEHSGDCGAPDWAAQFVSQSFPYASVGPVTLHVGESAAEYIELKNVGAKTWDSNTRLGTTQPRDRASPFAASDWLAPNRLAQVQGSVPPGGTYKFQFTFQAPDKTGDYDEFYGVVEEGVAWFSDPGQGGPPDDQLEAKLTVLAAIPDASAAVEPDASKPVIEPDASAPVSGPDASAPSASDASATHLGDAASVAGKDGAAPPSNADGSISEEADAAVASAHDAGGESDGHVTSGCGCASAPAPLWSAIALLALGILRRRRGRA